VLDGLRVFGPCNEFKSQTSAHVTDISFRLEGSQPVGYVNGYRSGPLQQCIVRVQN